MLKGGDRLLVGDGEGKREGEKQDHRNERDIADTVRANRHTGCQESVRFTFAIGNIHRIKNLNEDCRKEAERNGEQHVAKEHRSLRESGDIAQVPVWDHRQSKHHDDTDFHYHHWAGDFKKQLLAAGGDRHQRRKNCHLVDQ
ncbi:hypothetical protein SDC9_151592 [bioreactor metagenome]|uniref:Uncharacterized protein n=1 Tax=bioreactor metagenome TaxID=1076179 RepID=A0A645EQQ3_9ZZZZ